MFVVYASCSDWATSGIHVSARATDDVDQCFKTFCLICSFICTKTLEMQEYIPDTVIWLSVQLFFFKWRKFQAIRFISRECTFPLLTPSHFSAPARSAGYDFSRSQILSLWVSSCYRSLFFWKNAKTMIKRDMHPTLWWNISFNPSFFKTLCCATFLFYYIMYNSTKTEHKVECCSWWSKDIHSATK